MGITRVSREKFEDYIAADAITMEVGVHSKTVSFSIWERWGGEDEGPVSASITLTEADAARLKAMLDAGGF